MMKDSNQIIISQSPFIGIILRAILLGWIGFACFNFNVNQFFFGISIAAVIVFFFLINETSIVANEIKLAVIHKNWLPFLTKTFDNPIHNIEAIQYDKGGINIDFVHLDFEGDFIGGIGNSKSRIHIKAKGQPWYSFRAVGSKKKIIQLIEFVKENAEKSKLESNY